MRLTLSTCAVLLLAPLAAAEEPTPKPVPPTRPEMKQALEDLKKRQPRLPLPPPTAEEKAAGRVPVNNARMRQLHLPAELRGDGGGFARGADPAMSLDPTFKVLLFWIVSRVNNCHYCLGHQEHKLTAAGVTEDRLAALDCDWSAFTPAERAAFAFTRKLTFEPHRLADADLAALRQHYTEAQALEIVLTVAGYNAINRWTDSLGIPQEESARALLRAVCGESGRDGKTFLTPTSPAFRERKSMVAPLDGTALAPRPPLEPRSVVEAKLAECRTRTPRLAMADEAAARKALPEVWAAEPLPHWVRLLARFPRHGVGRVAGLRTAQEKGTLSPVLRAQLAWVAARQDRAWYAVGQAHRQLRALGQSDEAIFALDGDGASFGPAERAAFAFARKLTATPQAITDADIARLREHYPDGGVAEIVHRLTNAAFFNRLTEAAALPLEP